MGGSERYTPDAGKIPMGDEMCRPKPSFEVKRISPGHNWGELPGQVIGLSISVDARILFSGISY